jgi:uncharacterized delta-60 repeat protein
VKLAIPFVVERVIADGARLLAMQPYLSGTSGRITRVDLNGSIDRSFGHRGTIATDGEDAVVAPDGKILVSTSSDPGETAESSDARITRLLPDGHLDRSFGVDGHADIHFGTHYDYAETAALAANGDILVGGLGDSSLAVGRLKPDGSLDRAFGENGVTVLPLGGEVEVRDIAPTRSGGIVVQGGNEIETFLWKLNRDGSIDRHFGKNGSLEVRERRKVGGRLEELFYAPGIAVLPSGKLLLAASGSLYRGKVERSRVVAIRLHPDGRQDRSYGDKGWAIAGSGIRWALAEGLALLPGGVLAVATSFEDKYESEERDFGLIAFRPGGNLDHRFGERGSCRAGLSGRHEAVGIADIQGRAAVVGEGFPGPWLLDCLPLRRR